MQQKCHSKSSQWLELSYFLHGGGTLRKCFQEQTDDFFEDMDE